MKKLLFLIFLLIISIASFCIAEDQIEPNWESINSREYPQWFSDAKLGIFIHWGLTSVPAYSGKEQYSEWFLRGLQLNDTLRVNFQKKVFGENFTYRDYAPLFKAELFNPDEWATIFKNSGAKYVLFVSKHHDGYCLWPSKYAPNWNSVDVGPKRDIVGELTNSVRQSGLKMGLYYSLTEWNNKLHRWYTDPHDNIHKYVDQHMIPQFKELVTAYKPVMIFSDGEWFNKASDFHAAELISWYYNFIGPDAIVNNRWGGGSNTGYLTPEYSAGINIKDRPWTEVRGLGRSFGLNRNESLDAYMTSEDLVHILIESVAFGGGLTINVGPKSDGQIPLLQQERLMELGKWLKINGEAIYKSKAYSKSAEIKEFTMDRLDPEIYFNWVRNTPGGKISCDDFQVTWTGYIKPEHTDNYKFTSKADDGMKLWIDEQLVIDQWEETQNSVDGNVMDSDNSTLKNGTIKLKKGKQYPIKIKYFEKKHNAGIALFWESNKIKKEIVPTIVLSPSKNKTSTKTGLIGHYKSNGEYICYTTNNNNLYAIALEWPENYLTLNITKPQKEMKVLLIGTDIELPWKYSNNQVLIDISNVKFNDMPCKYAWTFKLENYLK